MPAAALTASAASIPAATTTPTPCAWAEMCIRDSHTGVVDAVQRHIGGREGPDLLAEALYVLVLVEAEEAQVDGGPQKSRTAFY